MELADGTASLLTAGEAAETAGRARGDDTGDRGEEGGGHSGDDTRAIGKDGGGCAGDDSGDRGEDGGGRASDDAPNPIDGTIAEMISSSDDLINESRAGRGDEACSADWPSAEMERAELFSLVDERDAACMPDSAAAAAAAAAAATVTAREHRSDGERAGELPVGLPVELAVGLAVGQTGAGEAEAAVLYRETDRDGSARDVTDDTASDIDSDTCSNSDRDADVDSDLRTDTDDSGDESRLTASETDETAAVSDNTRSAVQTEGQVNVSTDDRDLQTLDDSHAVEDSDHLDSIPVPPIDLVHESDDIDDNAQDVVGDVIPGDEDSSEQNLTDDGDDDLVEENLGASIEDDKGIVDLPDDESDRREEDEDILVDRSSSEDVSEPDAVPGNISDDTTNIVTRSAEEAENSVQSTDIREVFCADDQQVRSGDIDKQDTELSEENEGIVDSSADESLSEADRKEMSCDSVEEIGEVCDILSAENEGIVEFPAEDSDEFEDGEHPSADVLMEESGHEAEDVCRTEGDLNVDDQNMSDAEVLESEPICRSEELLESTPVTNTERIDDGVQAIDQEDTDDAEDMSVTEDDGPDRDIDTVDRDTEETKQETEEDVAGVDDTELLTGTEAGDVPGMDTEAGESTAGASSVTRVESTSFVVDTETETEATTVRETTTTSEVRAVTRERGATAETQMTMETELTTLTRVTVVRGVRVDISDSVPPDTLRDLHQPDGAVSPALASPSDVSVADSDGVVSPSDVSGVADEDGVSESRVAPDSSPSPAPRSALGAEPDETCEKVSEQLVSRVIADALEEVCLERPSVTPESSRPPEEPSVTAESSELCSVQPSVMPKSSQSPEEPDYDNLAPSAAPLPPASPPGRADVPVKSLVQLSREKSHGSNRAFVSDYDNLVSAAEVAGGPVRGSVKTETGVSGEGTPRVSRKDLKEAVLKLKQVSVSSHVHTPLSVT